MFQSPSVTGFASTEESTTFQLCLTLGHQLEMMQDATQLLAADTNLEFERQPRRIIHAPIVSIYVSIIVLFMFL
jgi:hypothetical protein